MYFYLVRAAAQFHARICASENGVLDTSCMLTPMPPAHVYVVNGLWGSCVGVCVCVCV